MIIAGAIILAIVAVYVGYVVFFQSRAVETFEDDDE